MSNPSYDRSKKSIQPTIDFSTYKVWLSAQSLPSSDSQPSQPSTSNSSSTTATTTTAAATTTTAEPSYPSSFAHIVELITTGQPIPGIQEIPDTVLTGKDTPSTAVKRRKPWEKGDKGTGEITAEGDRNLEK